MAESLEGAALNEALAIASMTKRMYADPRTRDYVLKAAKILDPDADIPELATNERLTAAEKKTAEEIQALKDEMEQERARKRLDDLRMAPVKAGVVSESELADLDKFMADNGYNVTQYALAARHYKQAMKSAEPRTVDIPARDPEDEKQLWAHPMERGKRIALQALQEMRHRA